MSLLKNKEQKESETRTSAKKWTDKDKAILIELYPYKTDKELCALLEKTPGQLRGMKERLGLNEKIKPFTDEEKERIKFFYSNNPNEMDLDTFARELGRQKTSISRYARSQGWTKNNRSATEESINRQKDSLFKYYQTEKYIQNVYPNQVHLLTYYAKNKHPKGMLGKNHSDETKSKMSITHKELAANMSYDEKRLIAMKGVDTKRKNGSFNTTSNAYSRCHGGYRSDVDCYFRSSWEANIARLFNSLDIKWEYESKRFNFPDVESGVLSYQPDFYLPTYDRWIEVKGWMDEKSKIRLDMFRKYYPEESSKLILIGEQEYFDIETIYSNIIDNWEGRKTVPNKAM